MLVIVDYGVGNLSSIQNMFRKAGAVAQISSLPSDIIKATKLLLPGMGHFDNCMQKLSQSGLLPVIEEKVFVNKVPVLGICVGLQMMMRGSEEGQMKGMSWINGKTIRFNGGQMASIEKIPNMGWLDIKVKKKSDLFLQLEDSRFYFAHSFHVEVDSLDDILVESYYGYPFTVGIEHDNILGVQFHPEKSHRFGMQLLKNFHERY